MIRTLCQNYEGYTKCDVKEAILERRSQLKIGNPSQKDFMKMISSKYGVNYISVKPCFITNALAIYGPDLPGV